MTILDYWEQRLTNWALWETGSRSVGVVSFDRLWWESPPPRPIPLVGEALDTDRLLHQLHRLDLDGVRQYEAVRIHYLWTGSEEMKAAQAGIPARTIRDRVLTAKLRLENLNQQMRRRRNPQYLVQSAGKV